jgi:hypothetical protein
MRREYPWADPSCYPLANHTAGESVCQVVAQQAAPVWRDVAGQLHTHAHTVGGVMARGAPLQPGIMSKNMQHKMQGWAMSKAATNRSCPGRVRTGRS